MFEAAVYFLLAEHGQTTLPLFSTLVGGKGTLDKMILLAADIILWLFHISISRGSNNVVHSPS